MPNLKRCCRKLSFCVIEQSMEEMTSIVGGGSQVISEDAGLKLEEINLPETIDYNDTASSRI